MKKEENGTRAREIQQSADWLGSIGPFCRVALPPLLRKRRR